MSVTTCFNSKIQKKAELQAKSMKIILFSLFFLFSLPLQAVEEDKFLYLLDFDGTTTQTAGAGQEKHGGWITAVDAVRSDNMRDFSNAAIRKVLEEQGLHYDELPYSIELTQEESVIGRELFNRADGFVPSYKVMKLPPVPYLKGREKEQIIIPGIYKLEYRASFREAKQLLQDYENSKKLAEKNNQSPESLFSVGLDIINANIAKKNTRIVIHTARGQSPETFKKLFKQMAKDQIIKPATLSGNINSLLDNIQIFPLSYLDGLRFGSEFSSRKRELIREEIKSFGMSLKPGQKGHVLFAEDEITQTHQINDLFEQLSKEKHLFENAYFHILFTGFDHFLKDLSIQNGERFITYHNGHKTAASEEHLKSFGLSRKQIKDMENRMKKGNQPVLKCKDVFLKR